jgi:hypothetical protein
MSQSTDLTSRPSTGDNVGSCRRTRQTSLRLNTLIPPFLTLPELSRQERF